MGGGGPAARHILNQPAFVPYNGGELSPGENVRTDDQILSWVARDGETVDVAVDLPVSTAKPQPPEVLAFLQKRFMAGPAAALHGMGDALVSEPDRVEELRATGLPTLVVFGEGDDAWSPSVQREMADRLGCPVVVVPESVHSPAVENPEVTVDALLRFWHA